MQKYHRMEPEDLCCNLTNVSFNINAQYNFDYSIQNKIIKTYYLYVFHLKIKCHNIVSGPSNILVEQNKTKKLGCFKNQN